MKYAPLLYARALAAALDEGTVSEDAIAANFARVIRKNGDLHASDKIIAAAERLLARSRSGKSVAVEFARPQGEASLAAFRSALSDHDLFETRINPRLVAGARITVDGERELDLSLAGKLQKLFAPLGIN
jgi:F0F1-type ATP synthase delta subunit